MSDRTQPDAVAVVVLSGRDEDTRVLIMRRARGAFAGAWTFVMGGVEPGERAPAAAFRELREETGLHAETLYLAGAFDVFYDPRRDCIRNVALFVARVDTTEVRIDDAHDDHAWVSFDQAMQRLEFASQRAILPDIRHDFIEREPAPWRNISIT